jgi:hypothetical protein
VSPATAPDVETFAATVSLLEEMLQLLDVHTVPLPVMLNVPEVADWIPGLVAWSVYPTPNRSMERDPKLATPLTALLVAGFGLSVPPPGLAEIESVIGAADVVTVEPDEVATATWTEGPWGL